MIEIVCIGIIYNIIFILQDTMISDPQLKSISLEFNYSLSQNFSLFTPIIASMKEPIPSIVAWFFGLLQILTAFTINISPNEVSQPEQTLMSMFSG